MSMCCTLPVVRPTCSSAALFVSHVDDSVRHLLDIEAYYAVHRGRYVFDPPLGEGVGM
jgi:hypothetical protein